MSRPHEDLFKDTRYPSASSSSPYAYVQALASSRRQARLRRIADDLTQIRRLDEQQIGRRQERRTAQRVKDNGQREGDDAARGPKACTTCRRAKTKCLNVNGEPCARCRIASQECVYPEQLRRGRKMNTRIPDLLDRIQSEIEQLSRDSLPIDGDLDRAASLHSTVEVGERDATTHTALHNPLGFLASAAAEHGDVASPVAYQQHQGLYWNNIYSVKPETDLNEDPIVQGILSEADLDRLLSLYFDRLRPLFMHLDPVVHTTVFLRLNSPFLTTAIASVAATYCPRSSMFASRLSSHAHKLAARAFADGSKSLEVVQAFLALVHWAPCSTTDWVEDKSWAYQGQAMRLACEIRLDLPMDKDIAKTYRSQLTDDDVDRLLACRQKTYLLVSMSEIAMSTQSGRADTTSGHRLLYPPKLDMMPMGDDTNEQFAASILLNHIFARALHFWHGLSKDELQPTGRENFVRSWREPLTEWKQNWVGKYRLVDVGSINTNIMLILLSLRVPDSHQSTQELLREICELAVQLIATVQKWSDETDFWGKGGLAYAHNYLIVQISYGAVLVLKLARMLEADRLAEVGERIEKIALILDQISSARPNAISFAGYYSVQIRLLVAQHDESEVHPAPPVVSAQGQLPLGLDAFDFSFPPLEEMAATLDASISDPILSFLAGNDVFGNSLSWQ